MLAISGLFFLTPIDSSLRVVEIALNTASEGRILLFGRFMPKAIVVEENLPDGISMDIYKGSGIGGSERLVLVNGVVRDGRDYLPLVRLATQLSRLGTTVFVPELRGYQGLRLDHRDIKTLVLAVENAGRNPVQEVGVVGFSAGGSQTIIAAVDPRVNGMVKGIGLIGAYGDLSRVVSSATTGKFVLRGQDYEFEPLPLVWVVLRNSLIKTLSLEDQQIMNYLLQTRAWGEQSEDHQNIWSRLSKDAKGVYSLLVNRDHDEMMRIWESGLPLQSVRLLEFMSPDRVLARVDFPAWIFYEEGDPYFSPEESRELASGMHSNVKLVFKSEFLKHAEIEGVAVSFHNLGRLWAYLQDASRTIFGLTAMLNGVAR
tara:strand:- start:2459 stop:3571 length:1113 start_codon:yes stop_codon:yes gene_type:complete